MTNETTTQEPAELSVLHERIKTLERERTDMADFLVRMLSLVRWPNPQSVLPEQVSDYLTRHGIPHSKVPL